jgi:hypothetical protein
MLLGTPPPIHECNMLVLRQLTDTISTLARLPYYGQPCSLLALPRCPGLDCPVTNVQTRSEDPPASRHAVNIHLARPSTRHPSLSTKASVQRTIFYRRYPQIPVARLILHLPRLRQFWGAATPCLSCHSLPTPPVLRTCRLHLGIMATSLRMPRCLSSYYYIH